MKDLLEPAGLLVKRVWHPMLRLAVTQVLLSLH